jgi:hypothetical protein
MSDSWGVHIVSYGRNNSYHTSVAIATHCYAEAGLLSKSVLYQLGNSQDKTLTGEVFWWRNSFSFSIFFSY